MAQHALPAGRTSRRALFGLFDADGWSWATVKALVWFVVIIMLLGYIPDRAYYFTVGRTVDLGLLAWSPINFCPPENRTLPCPAPVGAVVPWEASPPELSISSGREDGTAVQSGSRVFYVGGSTADGPTAEVLLSTVANGNLSAWTTAPALPEARSDAAVIVYGSSIYVIGGNGPDGAPTSTVFSLTPPLEGDLPAWEPVEDLALPEPRSGSAVVATADGIVLMGGRNASGPTASVWKSVANSQGALGGWTDQRFPLKEPVVDAAAAFVGEHIWLVGGTTANGARTTVEVALAVRPETEGETAEPDPAEAVGAWGYSTQTDLPEARSDAAVFTANGVLYVLGGSDGSAPRSELWWSVPDANGGIDSWKHLAQSDLGTPLEGSTAFASGSSAFALFGRDGSGLVASAARANLAPQEPFFKLGLLGATIPALKIDGEIGQQLGYLNAANVGLVNFVLLLLVGWGYAHKPQVRALWERVRRRR